jgi:hypothetical protein
MEGVREWSMLPSGAKGLNNTQNTTVTPLKLVGSKKTKELKYVNKNLLR